MAAAMSMTGAREAKAYCVASIDEGFGNCHDNGPWRSVVYSATSILGPLTAAPTGTMAKKWLDYPVAKCGAGLGNGGFSNATAVFGRTREDEFNFKSPTAWLDS